MKGCFLRVQRMFHIWRWKLLARMIGFSMDPGSGPTFLMVFMFWYAHFYDNDICRLPLIRVSTIAFVDYPNPVIDYEIDQIWISSCSSFVWIWINSSSERFMKTNWGRHIFRRQRKRAHPTKDCSFLINPKTIFSKDE